MPVGRPVQRAGGSRPEERRVGEEELAREAKEDEPWDGLVFGVAVDTAEAIVLVGAGLAAHASEHRYPRRRRAGSRPAESENGDDDAGQDTQEANGGEADDGKLRVAVVDPPELTEDLERPRGR